MRIEQPEHLRPLYIESSRRNMGLGVPGLLIIGMFQSALVLGSLALRASNDQPIAAWQWLGGVGMGPLCIAVVTVALRFHAIGNRFAEFDGDRVRLGPIGYTFRPSHLVYCKIERDSNFPEVSQLCFCFRILRSARPRYWSMMVENLRAAEQFRQEIAEHAAQPAVATDPPAAGR